MSHSIFAIVGPVMVGPSSSHTAGAVRLGNVARALFGELPEEVHIVLYSSFGEVYAGHGTDTALLAGVLGLSPSVPEIKQSFEIAEASGMQFKIVPKPKAGKRYHPNTAKFYFTAGKRKMSVLGSSVGGGRIEIIRIDDMTVSFDGEHDVIIFTADTNTDVLSLIHDGIEGSGARLLQFFSTPKNNESTRFVIELSSTPTSLSSLLQKQESISRISFIPHISLWENVCQLPMAMQNKLNNSR